jgi:hypothetical protein
MPKRLKLNELRPEIRVPEAKPFLLAYLDLVSSRVRRVAGYRARGATAMSLLDLAINQHILTFEIVEGGTRQQSIVDSLEAPRQTVRDGLMRLEKGGLIVRDKSGLYHPTGVTGTMANAMFETDLRIVARMCDAFAAYRAALNRTVSVLFGLAPAAICAASADQP